MSWLIDTSILFRLANVSDPLHRQAVGAIARLFQDNELLVVSPQNLIELWNVATRPAGSNGMDLSAADAAEIVDVFAAEFPPLSEIPELYSTWRKLVRSIEVRGKQVHDARIVAICQLHQVQNILTFNVRDFQRLAKTLSGLSIVDPKTLVGAFQ
jgi:predicted nucleic acid-binding protein